jgi:L-amino acid N-acyltransferase YncA
VYTHNFVKPISSALRISPEVSRFGLGSKSLQYFVSELIELGYDSEEIFALINNGAEGDLELFEGLPFEELPGPIYQWLYNKKSLRID